MDNLKLIDLNQLPDHVKEALLIFGAITACLLAFIMLSAIGSAIGSFIIRHLKILHTKLKGGADE